MYHHTPIRVRGHVRIRVWGLVDGVWQPTSDTETHNLVVDEGLDLLAEAETNGSVVTQVDYVALGNDPTDAAAGDTQLGDERFRKQITSYTIGVNPGEAISTVYVAPDEANGFVINEIGWFVTAGVGDPDAANAGVLMARIANENGALPLFTSNPKTNTQAVQIDRTVTYS